MANYTNIMADRSTPSTRSFGPGGALRGTALPAYSPPAASAPAPSYSPAPSPAPAPSPYVGYGGGGGGGGAAPAPAPQTDANYLQGDAPYQAQLAALMAALSNYQADTTAQQTKYDTQYGSAMQSLGYGIPDNLATPNVNEANPNAWNFQDLNSAAGRAQNNQMNDFASRGMLQSSLFGTASENLLRSLNDQRNSIDTAKSSFTGDLQRQLTDYQTQNKLSQQQAQADALARRTATYF